MLGARSREYGRMSGQVAADRASDGDPGAAGAPHRWARHVARRVSAARPRRALPRGLLRLADVPGAHPLRPRGARRLDDGEFPPDDGRYLLLAGGPLHTALHRRHRAVPVGARAGDGAPAAGGPEGQGILPLHLGDPAGDLRPRRRDRLALHLLPERLPQLDPARAGVAGEPVPVPDDRAPGQPVSSQSSSRRRGGRPRSS